TSDELRTAQSCTETEETEKLWKAEGRKYRELCATLVGTDDWRTGPGRSWKSIALSAGLGKNEGYSGRLSTELGCTT
ncbi:16469_t:CDS:1, partial [Gigaspora margarita]